MELNSELYLKEIYQIIVVSLPCNGWCLLVSAENLAYICARCSHFFQGNNNEAKDQKKTHSSHNNHKKLYLWNNIRMLKFQFDCDANEGDDFCFFFHSFSCFSIYLEIY